VAPSAVLAFMAAQGEADYINRKEMQKRGIEVAKAAGDGRYAGRAKTLDPATVKAWRAENGKSIAATAEHFDISVATVKRYCAA
jgi:putative DNA-invertase from lambdoid prophage Rac